LIHAATAVPVAKTSQNPPRPSTFGNAYTSAIRPITPPTAAPPKRRSPFWLLEPIVDSDTTKQVITDV
jgi:hypothetical protein